MKEGKKGEHDLYNDKPINKDKTKCDKCEGELVKLYTTLGKPKLKKRDIYRNMYWVCVCIKCRRYVRVLDHETKVSDNVTVSNKIHRLREK